MSRESAEPAGRSLEMTIHMATRELTIGEVAKFFFDQNTAWLRRRTREINDRVPEAGDCDGVVPGHRRENGKLGGGDRVFAIGDVVAMSGNLLLHGVLDEAAHQIVMNRVDALSVPIKYR